ncbi:MAG TPA: DUF1343 domain-containing protein [Negativicutes bacterium]|nr:DUF1343 domain-containing protein [Negativicutes bacterium]
MKKQRIHYYLSLMMIFFMAAAGGYRQFPAAEAHKKKPAPVKPVVQTVPAAPEKVRLGIDNIDQYLSLFAGKRVGLITNQTGIDSEYRSSIDVLKAKTNLVALYSPEHGIRGHVTAGKGVDSARDPKTGLPVYSLYGATKKPTPEMLEDIDVLVFDIQDVGARFYTYIYTMAYAMQSCAEQGKTFVVLDRPNPVGGEIVEGGTVKPGFTSFIGLYPIPMRHGLTVGELAQLFNTEYGIGCQLAVVPMQGWKRSMFYEETGAPWVLTSPNIPTPDTAVVYSGTGIFGGTNVSEGVGTTRPFEFVGAPWLDALELADYMNKLALPGVVFRPAYFTPQYSKQQGNVCGGVQIHVTDKRAYRAVKTGVYLLAAIKELSGDKFHLSRPGNPAQETIDLAVGDDSLSKGVFTPAELLQKWEQEAEAFKQISKKYYLYQ